jgi:hypothetical protein
MRLIASSIQGSRCSGFSGHGVLLIRGDLWRAAKAQLKIKSLLQLGLLGLGLLH